MNDKERYLDAAHGMQSGVAYVMETEPEPKETSLKHLRVGVNSAMCNQAALVRLLIAKGLFTPEEYEKEIADEMEREKERYERELSEHYRKPITLA